MTDPVTPKMIEAGAAAMCDVARQRIPATPHWDAIVEAVKVPVRKEVEAAIRAALDVMGLKEEVSVARCSWRQITNRNSALALTFTPDTGRRMEVRYVTEWQPVEEER